MLIGICISSLKVKSPGHCHSQWCLHQHIFMHLNTSHWWISTGIIISLHGKFRNLCTDRDIGDIDDISTQRTLFSKMQGNFGDWIKTCYYSKKVYTVIFEASLDKEMVPSLLQGILETADDDSTILSKAARSLRQLLLAVKCTKLVIISHATDVASRGSL